MLQANQHGSGGGGGGEGGRTGMMVMWQSTLQQQFSHIALSLFLDHTRTVWLALGKDTLSPRLHPRLRM